MDKEPTQALYIRLIFQDGKPILRIGPGNHTAQEWVLTRDQLCGLVLDAMPELLNR